MIVKLCASFTNVFPLSNLLVPGTYYPFKSFASENTW
jgi:hypothetical protein